jgi:hypothetical protein
MNWCKKHPKYQAKRRPRTLCDACWWLWLESVQHDKCKKCIPDWDANFRFCNKHKLYEDLTY